MKLLSVSITTTAWATRKKRIKVISWDQHCRNGYVPFCRGYKACQAQTAKLECSKGCILLVVGLLQQLLNLLNTAVCIFILPPFQAATKLPTLPILEEFFKLVSKNNSNCPPLSALSIHHDTPRLHQQAFLPPMAQTHANALATEVTQNRMAQRHHLSKALVVCLMKNHYSNKSFCMGKGTFRSGGFFEPSIRT